MNEREEQTMQTISKALARGTIATVAAGAMVMASATPALAQIRDRDNGIDVGDVIAGALSIGGIAAVASAAGRNRNGGYVYEGREGGALGYQLGGGHVRLYADEGTWLQAELLAEQTVQLTPEQTKAILSDNVASLYKIDTSQFAVVGGA